MSKYTTEVRFICESLCALNNSEGYSSVDNILNTSAPLIFDFSFPIFDENYRLVLEKKILKHYYTREIGEETFGLWKLKLDAKMNEIMPYYNKLYASELQTFNPLYTVNLTKTYSKTGTKNDSESTDISDTNSGTNTTEGETTSTGTGSGTSANTNYELFSDTPQGALNGVNTETYLTNATKTTDSGTNTSNTSNSSTSESTVTNSGTYTRDLTRTGSATTLDEYTETVTGYSGKDASELLLKFRETFLNIDLKIIKELEDLFMNLW